MIFNTERVVFGRETGCCLAEKEDGVPKKVDGIREREKERERMMINREKRLPFFGATTL